MRVEQLMTRNVASCRLGDSLNCAARLMWEHDCGCVPIADGRGKVVGIVTDRDVCMAAYTQGKALGDIPVTVAMTPAVVTCAPDESVEDAEAQMGENRIRRLPVVQDGQLVGILSLNDVALAAKDGRRSKDRISAVDVARTLATISEHRPPPHRITEAE